jgi:hypothetical protein
MKAPISKETAELRVINKYHKLHKPLIELVDALQNLEPGGTLVDDISLINDGNGKIRIAYVAKPIMLTIQESNRAFILRIVESQ